MGCGPWGGLGGWGWSEVLSHRGCYTGKELGREDLFRVPNREVDLNLMLEIIEKEKDLDLWWEILEKDLGAGPDREDERPRLGMATLA